MVATMIRMLVLYPRPTDPEAFDQHYRNHHVPLAKRLPGVVRYAASWEVAALRGASDVYLAAEVDWRDRSSMEADFASDLGKELAEDMRVLTQLCPGLRSMVYEAQEL